MTKERNFCSAAFLLALCGTLLTAAPRLDAADPVRYVNGTSGVNAADCGTVTKPCRTINYTVNNRAPTNSRVNVAAGTYKETIAIDKKNISLVGAGKLTTFIVGNNNLATITASGPSRLEIRNVSIKNGNPGILGVSAFIECSASSVEKNGVGIWMTANSFLGIGDSTVKLNSSDGLRIAQNSSANVDNCKIVVNGGIGVSASLSSSVNVTNSVLSRNQVDGLFLIFNSSATISRNTVAANKRFGVSLAGHSSIHLAGGNKITANASTPQDPAVLIGQGSQATIQSNPNTTKDLISANKGAGIAVGNTSMLFMVDGVVESNEGNGIQLIADSSAQFSTDAVITNNLGWGIVCLDQQGDSKYIGTAGNVSGNTAGQISCDHY